MISGHKNLRLKLLLTDQIRQCSRSMTIARRRVIDAEL
ncbi:hypothetical protein AfiDRAFT_0796 [Afipia sp. 1NLS2]|jgi:hypothetical protein|nr:hypothetical protein AfiDRAFT_0796 [Afipia sp. 1NLS2]WIG54016.1 MAG: hypothetical protein OJF48_004939 [Afipia sp.]